MKLIISNFARPMPNEVQPLVGWTYAVHMDGDEPWLGVKCRVLSLTESNVTLHDVVGDGVFTFKLTDVVFYPVEAFA